VSQDQVVRPASCRRIAASILGLFTFAALTLSPSALGARPDRAPKIPDRYIVVYDATVAQPGEKTKRLERAAGFRARLRYSRALAGFAAKLSPGALRRIKSEEGVDFVAPDRPVATTSAPLASGEAPPMGVRRIGAATASVAHRESAANVAVIDTGIDLAHPDLNAVSGANCVNPGTSAHDDNGHGTHVAGTIAAKNSGSGLVGVAPGTRLYAVKVLDGTGGGTFSQIICGIDWVTGTRTDADPANDIAVANMSLGGVGDPVTSCAVTTDPMHKAICNSTAAGVTYAVAAGNDGWDFDYAQAPDVPAAYPQVLTVTAVSDSDGAAGAIGGAPACATGEGDDRYASFSNFAATAAGQAHTIAAPGVCIRSTVPGGGYAAESGTSMATPHVAGAIALCIGEGGITGPCAGRSPAEVISRMRADAEAQTTAQPSYGFAGDPAHPVTGAYFGYLAWAPAADGQPQPSYVATTAAPGSVSVQSGSIRRGSVTSVATNDDVFFRTNSTTSGTRTSSWTASFKGISNALRNLRLAYGGKSSATCTQTLSVWRWTTSTWVQVDSRSLGTTELAIDRAASGTPADYVSGTSGDGELRVRVRCTRSSSNFYASADLLRIVFERPSA
jgi:subtilisin